MIIRLDFVQNFVPILLIALHIDGAFYEPHFDDDMYFDASAPEFEAFLTPNDFVAFSEHGSQEPKAPNSDLWDSDAMYNQDKFEGDIANDLNASTVALFIQGGPSGSQSEDRQLNAIRDRRQLWKDGKIPYAISSQYSSYSRSVIASAMNEYTANTCIQWVPRTTTDKDYVYILPDRGCYSMVGKTGGRQILSLGNGCIQKGIIIHEMMHAVGFFHEQSRTDRDNFITIMWSNIQPGMQGQFEKYSPVTIQTLGSDYDYNSIMHYGPKAFSRNGMPTIVPKKKVQIGQRSGFSQTDSYKINTLYECPSNNNKPAPTLPLQPVPVTSVVVPTTPIPAIIITNPPLTAPTERPIELVTSNSIVVQPETLPLIPAENCTNTRPDCDNLASQGWCTRNPNWMHKHCPVSCNMCEKSKVTNNGVCEDLRVDCPELVRRRYCITAQKFAKNFCAKSCGFCFSPPITETTPDLTQTLPVIQTTTAASLVSKPPLVTFWPIIRPEDRTELLTTTVGAPLSATKSSGCRDRKHFCAHWKNAGFCQGIFSRYMTLNCPASCGQC